MSVFKNKVSRRHLRLLLSFFFGGFIGILFLLLVSVLLILGIKEKYAQKVFPNVYLFSTLVSGKTEKEVKEFLVLKNGEIEVKKAVLFWENQPDKRLDISSSMINFSLDEEGMTNELMNVGRVKMNMAGLREIYRLLISPTVIEPKYKYEEEKLKEILDQMAVLINQPAKDALLEFREGKVVEFQDSKEGYQLDRKKTESLVLDFFEQNRVEQNNTNEVEIPLPVERLIPKVATSQTNRLGIRQLLGEGESYFSGSPFSRIHNIALASSFFHGVVIGPGEIFSFSQIIGEISSETGYQKAYVIKDKKTILEDGGGVCQVSTTLFRAALNAGLPIVERHPHYYRVGYYEEGGFPPGLDATVYPPSPDLKIKNDTTAFILIQVEVDKVKKHLVFRLYGTSDGRKVEISKSIIHSQTPPPEPIYVDEPTLPLGEVKRMDVAHWGAKVSFGRKVFNLDNSLKEEKTWWSNYTAWPAVYQRGTKVN